jgi:hypothetical protein
MFKNTISFYPFIIFCLLFAGCESESPKMPTVRQVLNPPPIYESETSYISSTKKVGVKGDVIYYKDYFKNSEKYKGVRLNIIGHIFSIEEIKSDGKYVTALQVYITHEGDSVIVYYPDTIDIYKDDWVVVYGEGGAQFEGTNAFGAKIKSPTIFARYIKKRNAP